MKGVLLTEDLYGCANCPGDRKELIPLSVHAVERAGLHVHGTVGGTFPEKDWGDAYGASEVTLMIPLRESHCAIHTWPTEEYVAVDIFTCGAEADALAAISQLVSVFRPERVVPHRIERGTD